jgi:hypothetical protein
MGGGGWAVRLHSTVVLEGAPTDFLRDSKTRIGPVSFFNQKHYCVLDWHVISLALIWGNVPGESLTNTQIFDIMAGIKTVFTLDGTTLVTSRTPAKRFTNADFAGGTDNFYANEGRIMAPTDLTVGRHTLQAVGFQTGLKPETIGKISFFIDSAETGTCIGDDPIAFRVVPVQ